MNPGGAPDLSHCTNNCWIRIVDEIPILNVADVCPVLFYDKICLLYSNKKEKKNITIIFIGLN